MIPKSAPTPSSAPAWTLKSEKTNNKTPSSGGTTLVVSGSSQPVLKSGVMVQDGTNLFEGLLNTGGSISGGSDVTISSYTGGGGFGPGGFGPGGFGPGGRPGGW